jgi:hypothetical protein
MTSLERGMKGCPLVAGAWFGPEALKAMGEAFDQAWADIAGTFGSSPGVIESARVRLAEAMLSVATEDSRDVAALKAGALQAMAKNYRSGIRRLVKLPGPLALEAPSRDRSAEWYPVEIEAATRAVRRNLQPP